MKKIAIYTDGACRGNPGPGGWGAVLIYNDQVKTLYGAELNTTNNRMELLAAINAIAVVKQTCLIDLTTDSQYVRNGITEWLPKWKLNHWRGSDKKPIKNVDLWQQLDEQAAKHKIIWHWVRGHSGHPENELADQLANRGIDELLRSTGRG